MVFIELFRTAIWYEFCIIYNYNELCRVCRGNPWLQRPTGVVIAQFQYKGANF